MQIAIAGGAVVGLCALCGLGSAALGALGSSTADATHTAGSAATQAAVTSPHVTQVPTQPPKPKAWVTVQTWSGTQNLQTPSFHLADGARIVWSAKATDQYGGAFAITSYVSDGSYGDLIANTSTPPDASGTYTAHGDALIYLKVDTFSCAYVIQVQEYR